jgi:hypothetical protein
MPMHREHATRPITPVMETGGFVSAPRETSPNEIAGSKAQRSSQVSSLLYTGLLRVLNRLPLLESRGRLEFGAFHACAAIASVGADE